jgi:sucrose-6-phosphate hydrolase SacC (GH32 family)
MLCWCLQVGTYDYAGCMTVPRLLHLDHDRLYQSPAPELLSLRRGESWQCGHVTLGPESTLAVPGVVGSNFLDIEVSCWQGCVCVVGVCEGRWGSLGT